MLKKFAKYHGPMILGAKKVLKIFKPVSRKRYKLACEPIKDSAQPVHLRSLIRVLDWHSMGSQGSFWCADPDSFVRGVQL